MSRFPLHFPFPRPAAKEEEVAQNRTKKPKNGKAAEPTGPTEKKGKKKGAEGEAGPEPKKPKNGKAEEAKDPK